MKHLFFILMALFLFASCGDNSKKSNNEQEGTENTEQTCKHSENMVQLADLLNDMDKYVDKEICVCGTAIHICKHEGKRLFLAVNEDDEDYLVAVANDELGSFDADLVGSHVKITGKLIKAEEDAVETHHEKEVYYYLDASEVSKCKCDGKHEGCKGHKN